MKQIKEFIIEAIKVNSKSKVNQKRDLENADIDLDYLESEIWFKDASDEQKYIHYIQNHKAKNDYKSMVKTNSSHNLCIWWYFSIIFDWEDGYKAFKDEIIKRDWYTEDELDKYVLERYVKLKGFDNTLKNMEKYFETYNVIYDRDKVK